jgi:nitrogen PTS system EIIA component
MSVKEKALYEYLDPALTCFIESDTRNEALKRLVHLLDQKGKLNNAEAFYDAILQREEMISTGIGMGIAVPHAKLQGYNSFFVAIGIHPIGIPWDALDGVPVRLIFMIGGPEHQQTEYLRLLSGLTLALKDENRRKKMLQLNEPSEIIGLFKGV